MPSANEVGRYFLTLTDPEAGDTISNLKLQKLLYYGQGFHLAIEDRPLFPDPIEPWQHGPVVRSVYAAYARFGAGSIPPPEDFDAANLSGAERSLLDEVYKVYGQYSAWRLRDMTHDEPPWQDAWRNGAQAISHDALKAYFKTLLTAQ